MLTLIYTGWPQKSKPLPNYQKKIIIFCTSLGNSADKLRYPEMCCLFSRALSSTELASDLGRRSLSALLHHPAVSVLDGTVSKNGKNNFHKFSLSPERIAHANSPHLVFGRPSTDRGPGAAASFSPRRRRAAAGGEPRTPGLPLLCRPRRFPAS